MNNTAPEAQTNTPNQPQGESIPGLVHTQETSNATATNPGAETPTQTPNTKNASTGHVEANTHTPSQQPNEFQRTRYAPDPPKAEEIRAKQPAGQLETTTPTAAPGLEEIPRPIENNNPEPTPTDTPTPAATTAPAETTTPEAVAPQDTPAQIDATGEVQTPEPTNNSSTDFVQTPAQPAETDNRAPAQGDQAQEEANAAAAMHIKKAPINLEPEQKLEGQSLSEIAITNNTEEKKFDNVATIEDVNTEAARGFAQIKGTHYEEPFLKGYSEAVAKVLSTKKSE